MIIKYIILTTSLATITIFDGNICINLVDISLQSKDIFHFNPDTLLNCIYNSSSSYIEAPNLGNFHPPKTLTGFTNGENFYHLRAFYESYQDIVNNIGRRPNNFIFSYHVYILNNISLFIGPFVILGIYIKNLLYNLTINLSYNFVYFVKNSKFKSLLALDIPLKAKNTFNYAKDMFKRKINFNFVPEHLRNFQIFPARPLLTPLQSQNPQIVALARTRHMTAEAVYTASRTVQSIANRLITLIEENGLTVHVTALEQLDMSTPINTTPERVEQIRDLLAGWDVSIMRALDRMMQAYHSNVNAENALRNMGVTLPPRDVTTPVQRARHAHARYKAKLIKDEN